MEEKSFQFYLWILKAGQIRVKVKFDPFSCTGQGHSTHQQHNQHHKWKSCCYVHHLHRTNELLAKIQFPSWLISLEIQQQYFLFRFSNPYLSGGQKKNSSVGSVNYTNRSHYESQRQSVLEHEALSTLHECFLYSKLQCG